MKLEIVANIYNYITKPNFHSFSTGVQAPVCTMAHRAAQPIWQEQGYLKGVYASNQPIGVFIQKCMFLASLELPEKFSAGGWWFSR
jgi:hypothetical protein